MTKKKLKELIDYIKSNLSSDNSDTLCELMHFENDKLRGNPESKLYNWDNYLENYIDEILEYTNIKNEKLNKDCDYWNDKNENCNYYCDLTSEWAGNEIDIYNHDLFQKAWIFREDIENALNEFGTPDKADLIKIFQQGQHYFYNNLASEIVNLVSDFVKE
jgi:hypothetical protein